MQFLRYEYKLGYIRAVIHHQEYVISFIFM